jgi:hypothetical protein
MKLAGQQREHLRPPRIAVREGSCGRLKGLHALGVNRPELAVVSPTVREHGAGEPVCVAELLGEPGGVEQRLAMLGVPGLALRLYRRYPLLFAILALTVMAPDDPARPNLTDAKRIPGLPDADCLRRNRQRD